MSVGMPKATDKKVPHFHVKSVFTPGGEFSFGTERIVNESDMLELVRRFATGWLQMVMVSPCFEGECRIGDIGG